MYTIFKNDTSIILTDDRNILSSEGTFLWKEWNDFDRLKSLLSKSYNKIYLFDKNLEKMWDAFKNKFTLIEASGGIVKNSHDKILFILRHDTWDLPKGKIEENESKEEAAVREVKEECGFKSLKMGKFIGTTYHLYHENEVEVLKVSHWYEMFSDETALIPQTEEGITEIKWVAERDLKTVLQNTYPNIELLTDLYFREFDK